MSLQFDFHAFDRSGLRCDHGGEESELADVELSFG
jgi:hypothetical protein